MALFSPRTFNDIMKDMLAKLLANTPLTDVNDGSIWTTLLEAAAQEDDEQYFQMLEIIRGYSLDTVFGADLDNRAFEYFITRQSASKATSQVTITDTAVTKVSTSVYAGLPGAVTGSTVVYGNSSVGFKASGSIIIGRGTANVEKVPYSSINTFANYVQFNLSASTGKDHGTDETIILAQGGDRAISSGTGVKVPSSDISPEIKYTLDNTATILDGESQVTGVNVTCLVVGIQGNVPIGAIQAFNSKPFSTATVKNPSRIVNGVDTETDQQLRDRIKQTIQSLSRGTGIAITQGILGLVSTDDNKRVVSVSLRNATVPGDVVKIFVDDGTGFIPTFNHVGVETVKALATGGEKYLQAANFPMVKAFTETQNAQPYNIVPLSTLIVTVNGTSETITFLTTDFVVPAAATANEILTKINSVAKLFEARATQGGTKVKIFARSNSDEEIAVTGGTANSVLNFQTDVKLTSRLYLTRNNALSLLSKDGTTAAIEAGATASYNFSAAPLHLSFVVDGKINNIQKVWFLASSFTNPAVVPASQIVSVISALASGITATLSSNNSRFTITSLTARSAASKIRIVADFTNCFNEESGVFVDRTEAFEDVATPVTLFGNNLDYVYLGHTDVPFDSVFVALATMASASIQPHFEYYNGTSFVAVGVNDTTLGFTQSGHILFAAPFDWVKTTFQGVTAFWLRIQRTQTPLTTSPIKSRIRICGSNEIFQFGETEVVGANKDYTLNRYIGQIELANTLIAGDMVTLGSFNTRPYVVSGNSGAYAGLVGTVLTLLVDGISEAITFVNGDFAVAAAATTIEVATAINARVPGVLASSVNGDTKVQIQGNRWNGGSLQIQATGANAILNFPTTAYTGLISHVPAIESVLGPWTFALDDTLIIIVDDNFAATFTVPLFKQGAAQGGTTTTLIVDTTQQPTFPVDGSITGFDLVIKSGAQAGQRRTISGWTAANGHITLASALPGAPAANDTYQILPTTSAQVVSFLTNKQVTLLTTRVEVRASDAGRRLQLASLNASETAGIFVSGGNANTKFSFASETHGIDGYRYFIGLAQKVQWTIDGRADNQATYPGLRAAGVQAEVLEAVTVPVVISLQVTTSEGISLSGIVNNIKSAVTNYVNGLPVGSNVILSEIVVAVKGVSGVSDAVIKSPTANIAIADNQQAKVTDAGISVV